MSILASLYEVLSAGVAFYRMYTLKLYLADVFFYTDENKSIISAFRKSSHKMNGKCARVALFELRFIYMKILSLLILPALYYLPKYSAMKSYCVLQKEIPYTNRRLHTEKAVVFYF